MYSEFLDFSSVSLYTLFKCHLPPVFFVWKFGKTTATPQFFCHTKKYLPPRLRRSQVNAVGKRTEHHDNPQPSPTDDPRAIGFVSSVVCVEVEETALHIVPWRFFFCERSLDFV